MGFAKVFSAQTTLLSVRTVSVEVDISKGLHAFTIVGLPDKAVEESRDRVSAAIKNSGFTSPKQRNQKIVISLAPADLKKEGPVFDCAIAIAYLVAAGDITGDFSNKIFLGELSLDGSIRPIRGVLPVVRHARDSGFKEIYLPDENVSEGALIEGIAVYGAGTLRELIVHLSQKDGAPTLSRAPKTEIVYEEPVWSVGFEDIRGQASAKRGLEVAAAGGHNIAFYGPPGTGKTMLARTFASILPPLVFDEVLEITGIHSIAGALSTKLITHPPFRAPHHSASHVALVGGGTNIKPGEITLAHRGVLFLDEFPEFDRRVIEALRQPLEDRVVSVSRAKGSAVFPANFILIAAMNPCPCGNFGSQKQCVCPPAALMKYERKISGPIMDRIDMWIEVPNVEIRELGRKRAPDGETAKVRMRVKDARKIQNKRFDKINSELSVRELEDKVPLSTEVRGVLDSAASKLDLSPRAYHRVIKLARTIADLGGSKGVYESHILEAIQYRPKKNTL